MGRWLKWKGGETLDLTTLGLEGKVRAGHRVELPPSEAARLLRDDREHWEPAQRPEQEN